MYDDFDQAQFSEMDGNDSKTKLKL